MISYLLIEPVETSMSTLTILFASSANGGSTCNRLSMYLLGLWSMLAISQKCKPKGGRRNLLVEVSQQRNCASVLLHTSVKAHGTSFFNGRRQHLDNFSGLEF